MLMAMEEMVTDYRFTGLRGSGAPLFEAPKFRGTGSSDFVRLLNQPHTWRSSEFLQLMDREFGSGQRVRITNTTPKWKVVFLRRFPNPIIAVLGAVLSPSRLGVDPIEREPQLIPLPLGAPSVIVPQVPTITSPGNATVIAPKPLVALIPSDLVSNVTSEVLPDIQPESFVAAQAGFVDAITRLDAVSPSFSLDPAYQLSGGWSGSYDQRELYTRLMDDLAEGFQMFEDLQTSMEARVELQGQLLAEKNWANQQALLDQFKADMQASMDKQLAELDAQSVTRQWLEEYKRTLEDEYERQVSEFEREAARQNELARQQYEQEVAAYNRSVAAGQKLAREQAAREALAEARAKRLVRARMAAAQFMLLQQKGTADMEEIQYEWDYQTGARMWFDPPSKNNRRPYRRDGKDKVGRWRMQAARLAFAATEVLDLREILDKNLQVQRHSSVYSEHMSFEKKIRMVIRSELELGPELGWSFDADQFLVDFVLNQIEDSVVGRSLGSMSGKLNYASNKTVRVSGSF